MEWWMWAVLGAIDLAGFTGSAWMEWMLFSIFAAGTTALFRQKVLERFGPKMPSGEVDTLIGEVATPLEGIQPGGVGKAELRGSSWSAFNAGSQGLSRGQRCLVERVDGLTLFIRAESGGSSH